MDDLVIRLQGLSVALVVLEATGGFEATVAAALAGVRNPFRKFQKITAKHPRSKTSAHP